MAPATLSCAISLVLWYFLLPYKAVYILLTIFLFVAGIIVSDDLAKEWGKDPHCIVIDEYASILFPLFFTPQRILPLLVTFLLFRFFDIVKPPPVRNLENLKGGWGIMFDDLFAAIYTTVIILILRYLSILF